MTTMTTMKEAVTEFPGEEVDRSHGGFQGV